MADEVIISPDSQYQHLHNDYEFNINVREPGMFDLTADGKKYKTATHYIYSKMMPTLTMSNFINYQLDGKTVRQKANGILFGKKVAGARKLASASELIILQTLREGYQARFNDHRKRFGDKLLGTGNEPIVYIPKESTFLEGDITVLGINSSGNGQNKLGSILETIREELLRDHKIRSRTDVNIPDMQRLYRLVIRKQLLMNQLSKGHLPSDYSLEGLYANSKNIDVNDKDMIEQQFNAEYPLHKQESYWVLYKRSKEGKSNKKVKLVGKKEDGPIKLVDTEKELTEEQKIRGGEGWKRGKPRPSSILAKKRKAEREAKEREEKGGIPAPIPEEPREPEETEDEKRINMFRKAEQEREEERREIEKPEPTFLPDEKINVSYFDNDIVQEFEYGNLNWIEREYDTAIRKQSVLEVYLNHAGIDYSTLLNSVAKQKLINMYLAHKIRFTTISEATKNTNAVVQGEEVSIQQFLQDNNINLDMIRYIGEEGLSDLRDNVFAKYQQGALNSINNLEEIVKAEFMTNRASLSQSVMFPKFVPKIKDLAPITLKLIAEDIPDAPMSPIETYFGEPLDRYYADVSPEGACGEAPESVCPLGDGDSEEDDGNYREEEMDDNASNVNDGDYGYDRQDEDGDEDNEDMLDPEDRKRGDDDEEGDDEGGRNGGGIIYADGNLDRVIGKAKPVPLKKYVMPINPIKLTSVKDYPYEWLHPSYIDMFKINGMWYPSVSHYVISKLATPKQVKGVLGIKGVKDKPLPPNKQVFANQTAYSTRLWIQKDPTYNYNPKVPVNDPKRPGKFIPDKLQEPKDFKPVSELVDLLAERIQTIYNSLFVMYANKILNIKMKYYPFRQILYSTKGKSIKYYDQGKTAVAGSELSFILTKIRDNINDIEEMTVIPAPVFNARTHKDIFNYIKDRTDELIRSTVLVSKYRLAPRDDYMKPHLNVVGYEDAKFSLINLYNHCRDINYNEVVESPDERYIAYFNTKIKETVAAYFPDRKVYNLKDMEEFIAMKGRNDQMDFSLNDKIFVDIPSILRLIWIHVVYVCLYLNETTDGSEATQDHVRMKIRDSRMTILKEKLGTPEKVALDACINTLAIIHDLVPMERKITLHDLEFVKNFIFPGDIKIGELKESESYNKYEDLLDRVTSIYGADQDVVVIKKLSWILDQIVDFPNDASNREKFMKLSIRVKFFASQ